MNEMDDLDRESRQAMHSLMEALVDPSVKPIRLPLLFMKYITSDFSKDEKIGGGGFGTVYKGRLWDGKVVAVKKLKKVIPKDYKNLENELRCMVKATHGNIIRLLGYTLVAEKELVLGAARGVGEEAFWEDANRELILCSEYAPNEDLSSYIEGICRFHWRTTYSIIKGICEGVDYLHRQPEPIIHRDLKPANILLDRNMVPKLTDFGLSRCFHEGQNDAYTKAGGTLGYIAPESYNHDVITRDSDMYSIGVIIMDLLVGHEKCMSFVMSRVTGRCKAGHCKVKEVLKIWDQYFKKVEVNNELLVRDQIQACAEIAIECVDMDPSNKEECTCKVEGKKTEEPSSNGIPSQLGSSPSNMESTGQTGESDSAESKQSQLKTGESSSAKTKQRPSAYYIIEKLKEVDETGNSNRPSSLSEDLNLTLSTKREEVLDIHPPGVICFGLGLDGRPSTHALIRPTAGACVLSLTNNSPHHHVAFWIPRPAGMASRFDRKPIPSFVKSITVGPMSTEVVTFKLNIKEDCPPVDTGMVNILTVTMSARVFRKCRKEYKGEIPFSSLKTNRLQELGGKVHETLLTSVISPVQDPRLNVGVFGLEISAKLRSTDVHPTKPWILSIRGTCVYIWNYETQEQEWRYELGKKDGSSVKFIPRDREQCIVAGDSSGAISVIMAYDTNAPVKKLEVKELESHHKKGITSLAIHPGKTHLLLSADEDGVINLHDWRENRVLIKPWKNRCRVTQVKFNPKDDNTFVTADCKYGGPSMGSCRGEIKVWAINSTEPLVIVQECDHCEHLEPFDYICTGNNDSKSMIATLSSGVGVQIWDLLEKKMVHTFSFKDLYGIAAVAYHPTLPVILVLAVDPEVKLQSIFFCSSTNYRAQKMIQYTRPWPYDDEIYAFGVIGQTRLVIRYAHHIEVLEIDMRTIAYQQ